MNFKELYSFLRDLQENNNKAWLDENRNRYEDVRDGYIDWLDQMNKRLSSLHANYTDTPGKKGINRINNNLMFHPDKPIYKDHFGAGLDQATKMGDFYIQLGTTESFIAGGYYNPKPSVLKNIREGIDFEGNELQKILNKPSFKKTFGELIDTGNKLKTAPKGYSPTHKHIDLLRNKTFAVQYNLTEEQVTNEDYDEKVIKIYKEMLPFRTFMNRVATL